MLKRGRPATSKFDRAEQLRRAKRAQRRRERDAGLIEVQIKLPQRIAAKLKAVLNNSAEELEQILDESLIRIADYPMLADISWNDTRPYIPAREAFALYERNWRFVEVNKLEPNERKLIERLSSRYGSGIVHA